jgi:hypothetical protein
VLAEPVRACTHIGKQLKRTDKIGTSGGGLYLDLADKSNQQQRQIYFYKLLLMLLLLLKKTGFVGYSMWKIIVEHNQRIFGNTFLDLKSINMLLTDLKLAKR